MKRIRGASGLGDAVYMYPIVRHYANLGEQLEVCTRWPDVFRNLPVKIADFSRQNINILAHYARRKGNRDTNQFQDCCIVAGIKEEIPFTLDWKPKNSGLIAKTKESGKPALLVQMPRAPMGRKDGFGASLLPKCGVIQSMIDELKERAYIVQVGGGKCLHEFKGIDLDMANKTSVTDLIDLHHSADAMLGYPSNIIALAEAFDKPLVAVWSRRGLKDGHSYVRQISPRKILSKPTSRHIVDDQTWSLDGFLE